MVVDPASSNGVLRALISGIQVSQLVYGIYTVGQLFLRLLLMIVVPLVFFVAGGWRCGHWRHSQARARRSEVVWLLSGDLCDLSRSSESRSPTRSSPADESIRVLPRPCSNATPLMRRRLSKPRRRRAARRTPLMQVVETIVPKNPFSAIVGQRRSEHASPHVLCA